VEHSTIFICYATCANNVQLVQMRGGTQYDILLCNLCKWCQTCANEGETQYNVHLLYTLCRWRVEHSTKFICYATCANEGYNIHLLCNLQLCRRCQLVQMWGGIQCNIHLLCNLCKWRQTCAVVGWNTVQYSLFVMQLVQMRGGTQYNWSDDPKLYKW